LKNSENFNGAGGEPSNIMSNYFDNNLNQNQQGSDLFYKYLKAFQVVSKSSLQKIYIDETSFDNNNTIKDHITTFGILIFKINTFINYNYLQLMSVCKNLTYTEKPKSDEEQPITYIPEINKLTQASGILAYIFSFIELSLWPDKYQINSDTEKIVEDSSNIVCTIGELNDFMT
jgi:hypothetical protein